MTYVWWWLQGVCGEVRRQLSGVGSLLPLLCGFWEETLGDRFLLQVSFLELNPWPLALLLLLLGFHVFQTQR